MTPQTTQATGPPERRRSTGSHLSVSDLCDELGIAQSTIYDRRRSTAPNPLAQLGGER